MPNVKTFCAVVFLGVSVYGVLYFSIMTIVKPADQRTKTNRSRAAPTGEIIDLINSHRDSTNDNRPAEQIDRSAFYTPALQSGFSPVKKFLSTERSQTTMGMDMARETTTALIIVLKSSSLAPESTTSRATERLQASSSPVQETRTFQSTERPQTTTVVGEPSSWLPTIIYAVVQSSSLPVQEITTATEKPQTSTMEISEDKILTTQEITSESELPTAILPPVTPDGPLTLQRLQVKFDAWFSRAKLAENDPCPSFPEEGGRIPVRKESITLDEVEKELAFVEPGGRWRPMKCQAKRKVAIVIPFRDRQEHLNIFLRHMHVFLKLQLLDYGIFVVEQAAPERFNRGMLMNVGFVEALKIHKFACVVFHDVDLLPEDTRNEYSCPTSPRHMCPQVSSLNYKLLYAGLFGGVEGLWTEHFVQINGFPNRYWGWGGEDDDLFERIKKKGLRLTRPDDHSIGRYTMLSHGHKAGFENPDRFNQLRNAIYHAERDGLNSLSYDVSSKDELPLYTLITVRLHRV